MAKLTGLTIGRAPELIQPVLVLARTCLLSGLGGAGRFSSVARSIRLGTILAALCYNHVKVRVRIFEQRSQGYRFYRFTLLAVIILRFIIDQSYSP